MPYKTRQTKKKITNHIQDNDIAATLFQNNGLNIVNTKNTKKQVADVGKLRQLHNYPSAIVIDLDDKKMKKLNTDEVLNNFNAQRVIREAHNKRLNEKEIRKSARIAQNISHNLSTYINKTFFGYDGVRGVSNGYVKLWEIYQQFGKEIMKSVKSPTTFLHMCEAPGNWIKCTRQYMTRFHTLIRYKWFANSLNPHNAKIKDTYGKVFQDELKYMASYPNQWVFGADDTGDITKVANIKNIAKRTGPVALITGDAGLGTDTDVFFLQKLEVAQMVMCLACNARGGSCVIKYFASSYSANDIDLMKSSIPYVASIIATHRKYYNKVHIMKPITSNPMSGEYYLVGIGFKGISPAELEKYYQLLDNFQIDQPVIHKYQPDAAIESAIASIYQLNARYDAILNTIMECYLDKDSPKECKLYLEDSGKYTIKLFKEWIKRNRYSPMNIK